MIVDFLPMFRHALMRTGTLQCVSFALVATIMLATAQAQAQTPPQASPQTSAAYAPDKNKAIRYAFEIAETSMDPHKVSDVYSTIVHNAIFDTPVRYDYLARPLKVVPNTLTAYPEITDNFKTYTFHVKPGIHFADDPAFNGKKRELVAEDYVYSIKRLFDPKLSAPLLAEVEGYILGSEEMLKRVRKANKMDYDAPLEGLRALDRYTFQIKLREPKPGFIFNLTDCRVACAVAREVVEKYGTDIGSHPVGTGAYKLTEWKRSSRMVFEYNPNFREAYFEGEPAPDDAAGQSILAKMKGKRLPQVYRFEVAIIEERQPRYLSFVNNEFDMVWLLPEDFANIAIPGNKLAPNLQKLGVEMQQVPALDLTYVFFNMDHPVVGGYTPEKIALRRAVSLAYKTHDEINIIRRSQAIPANTPYAPGAQGWEPGFKTTANEYDPFKARALLDMYGYKINPADCNKTGDVCYRTMPDGSPLKLIFSSTPTDRDKQFDEVFRRSLDEINVRLEVNKGKWPDLLKQAQAGKLMMWQLGGSATSPSADTWLTSLYGPNAGYKGNLAHFRLAQYDRLFEQAQVLDHSPERTKLYQEMARLVVAYAPWKINCHRILTDITYPYVIGFRRPLVQSQSWWRFVDVDVPLMKQYEAKR